MNTTFNFYNPQPQVQTYQPLPSAPPYVAIPVAAAVPVHVPEESDEQKYDTRKKIIGVIGCWLIMGLLLYLFIYWANHVTAS
jgi:hypothetical protein